MEESEVFHRTFEVHGRSLICPISKRRFKWRRIKRVLDIGKYTPSLCQRKQVQIIAPTLRLLSPTPSLSPISFDPRRV
jgi:hypothetical protein